MILVSRSCSKSWLDQLAKRWMVPPICQQTCRDLRSIETLLLPHRIPVPMSRVCFSFRKEGSALTWANRVMSSANQPSSSHQSSFRSSAEYPSPVWRSPTLPSSSSLIWASSVTFSTQRRCGFLHRPLEHAAWFLEKRRQNCLRHAYAWFI